MRNKLSRCLNSFSCEWCAWIICHTKKRLARKSWRENFGGPKSRPDFNAPVWFGKNRRWKASGSGQNQNAKCPDFKKEAAPHTDTKILRTCISDVFSIAKFYSFLT